jgi:hypothetical protein
MKDRISPCCGSELENKGELYPENPETYLTDVSPNWVIWYKCKKCGNKVRVNDLVTEEEYKSILRTKLIDKILEI